MARTGRIFQKVIRLKPIGFWPGFVLGLFYFSYVFWWFWSTYSLVSLETKSDFLSFSVILFSFAITVLAMSMFLGFFGFSLFHYFNKIKIGSLPFFYAGSFVLIEYLRVWFFGALLASKESLWGPHWTFGNPAYLLVDLGPIRQSASFWGIYGVDFLAVFLITAFFLLIKYRQQKTKTILGFEILCAVLVLTLANASSPPGKIEARGDALTVSVIQTKNPAKIFLEPKELIADLTEKDKLLKEASKKSDIVVFPESSNFSKSLSDFLDSSSAQKYFDRLSPENVLIIDNNRILEQRGIKSKTIAIDSKEGPIDFYDKKLLTPGGETIPYLAALPFLAVERIAKNDFFSSRSVFIRGAENGILNLDGNKMKIEVCSEIVSPNISREGGEFDFMINLNNLGVFNGNQLIERELLAMARFRAAENGKYLIISSNFGHSYVINQVGKVVDSTDSTGYKILTKEIVPNQNRTWYNKSGDIPVLVLSFLIVLLGLKTARSRKF